MSISKLKIFFYVNLLLKIFISIFFLPVFLVANANFLFQDFFINIPLGVFHYLIIVGFILWYFIIFCERANEYQKFKIFYFINNIAELILIYNFFNLVLYGAPGAFFFWVFSFIIIIIIFITSLVYYLLKRKEYLHSKVSTEGIEKLKDILSVSDRIKLERVQNVLNLDDKVFDEKIIEWAKEFGFRIDGEYLITQGESVEAFVSSLEKKFIEWEKKEKSREGKF